MSERLTWEQIQEKYPDQWVGLVDVKYIDDDGISVESAIVKYADKTQGELTKMVLEGKIVSRHTNPDGHLQLGVVGIPERLTREQMAEKYPDQWLGISNIQYKDNDGITIESADVIYTNKTRDELLELQINSDNIIGWYTTEDNLHLGLVGGC